MPSTQSDSNTDLFDRNKRVFFSHSLFGIATINGIQAYLNYIYFYHVKWLSLFGIASTLLFFILAYLAKKKLNLCLWTVILTTTCLPYLTATVLTSGSYIGAVTLWYIIFPVYAHFFTNTLFTKISVAFVCINFIAGILIEYIDPWGLSKIRSEYPYLLLQLQSFLAVATCALHIYLYIKKNNELDKSLKNEIIAKHNMSRLTAVGELAGNIAHEINTPLNAINMTAQNMEEKLSGMRDEKKLISDAQLIQEIVLTVSHTVRAMLDFTRNNTDKDKIKTDVMSLLNMAIKLCASHIKKIGIDLSYNKDALSTSHVLCIPNEITQIFLILINNSSDAIKNQASPWIRITIEHDVYYYKISVTDSGKRIPDTIAKNLFKAYFTTKNIGVGTGLGLNLAKKLAERQNGILEYDPSQKNTTFNLYLPLADKESSYVQNISG